MPLIPKTGAYQSPLDPRDWTLASVGAPTAYPDSRFIDQSKMIPSMQGQIGCCVGCSYEEIVRKMFGIENELSWRFVYAVCKCLEGTPGYTQFPSTPEGTYPALAAMVIRKYGVPQEQYCINDVSLDHETFCYQRKLENIPLGAFNDAELRKAGADMAVPLTLDGIKQAINYAADNNGGVAILRAIGDSYWKDVSGNTTYDKAKLLPIRFPQTIVSGHEEFLYGYDTEVGTNRMRVYWLNHWSDEWCSTGGDSHDGGRGWEYADVWLPNIKEVRVSVAMVPVVVTFKYTFSQQLSMGQQGADIVALQHVLKLEGFFPQNQVFTGFYGSITAAGVYQWQQKHNVAPLDELNAIIPHGSRCGSKTIAALNAAYG